MSHREAGERLLQNAGTLAEKITEKQYRLQPDLMERFGPIGKIRTKEDSRYSLSYLAESVLVKSPSLFTHYISWLKVLLAGYRVSAEDLEVNLQLIKESLEEEFEHPYLEFLLEYLEMGIEATRQSESQSSFIHASLPYGLEAQAYVQHLLHNRRKEAFELIESELDAGASIRDMYCYIFQPAQYEIGRLWQKREISVGQEHFAQQQHNRLFQDCIPDGCFSLIRGKGWSLPVSEVSSTRLDYACLQMYLKWKAGIRIISVRMFRIQVL